MKPQGAHRPLCSTPGIRFPGVGVLPGVPTGTGIKAKGPGMSLLPLIHQLQGSPPPYWSCPHASPSTAHS